ncbi:unnamed protein product, partial [Symbiodinium necroappetens]
SLASKRPRPRQRPLMAPTGAGMRLRLLGRVPGRLTRRRLGKSTLRRLRLAGRQWGRMASRKWSRLRRRFLAKRKARTSQGDRRRATIPGPPASVAAKTPGSRRFTLWSSPVIM